MHDNLPGNTDFKVVALCLGAMTFVEQNSETAAHAQLDRANIEAAVDASLRRLRTVYIDIYHQNPYCLG